MNYSLITLFINDSNKNQNDDEKLASNLYLCSLCISLNELNSIKQKLASIVDISSEKYKELNEYYDTSQKKNDWLLELCTSIKKVQCINFDKLPKCCGINGIQTVDSLIIDCSQKRMFLIEFKNCNKKTMITNYLCERDGVYNKFKHSKNILKELLINGFTSNYNIIGNTEVIVVYNKNDCVEYMNYNFPKRRITSKNSFGKQIEATKFNNKIGKASSYDFRKNKSRKEYEEIVDTFKKNIKALGFSEKCSFDKKQSNFTLLGAQDISNLIDEGCFASVDWGDYKRFFNNAVF